MFRATVKSLTYPRWSDFNHLITSCSKYIIKRYTYVLRIGLLCCITSIYFLLVFSTAVNRFLFITLISRWLFIRPLEGRMQIFSVYVEINGVCMWRERRTCHGGGGGRKAIEWVVLPGCVPSRKGSASWAVGKRLEKVSLPGEKVDLEVSVDFFLVIAGWSRLSETFSGRSWWPFFFLCRRYKNTRNELEEFIGKVISAMC